jgi:hypothetical protein
MASNCTVSQSYTLHKVHPRIVEEDDSLQVRFAEGKINSLLLSLFFSILLVTKVID